MARHYWDFPPPASPALPRKRKSPRPSGAGFYNILNSQEKNGAAERNRTFDLTLTKGMLYQLSYGSVSWGQ
jgi:hypothetical protein